MSEKDLEQKLSHLEENMEKMMEHQKIIISHQQINDEKMHVIMQRSQDVVDKADFIMNELTKKQEKLEERVDSHEHIITGNGSPGLDEQVRNLNNWKEAAIKENSKITKRMIILGVVLVVLLSVLGQSVVVAQIPAIFKLLF